MFPKFGRFPVSWQMRDIQIIQEISLGIRIPETMNFGKSCRHLRLLTYDSPATSFSRSAPVPRVYHGIFVLPVFSRVLPCAYGLVAG